MNTGLWPSELMHDNVRKRQYVENMNRTLTMTTYLKGILKQITNIF